MSFWQAIFLGFLQGATELFPVSSLGHAVILPKLLGWHYNQSDPSFLPYLTLLHLGTAGALLVVFRDDWVRLTRAFFAAVYRGRLGHDPNERLAVLLLVGSLPAVIIAGLFEHEIRGLFTSARIAAVFLMVNGLIMAGGEVMRRRDIRRRQAAPAPRGAEDIAPVAGAAEPDTAPHRQEAGLGFRAALAVGGSQALALLPGISRSGVTMTSGLLAGLDHESAARFSFLLATPIILAAGLVEAPQLSSAGDLLPRYLAGAVVAAITAYVTTRFLMRYFRSGRLDPFAAYCILAGVVGVIFTG